MGLGMVEAAILNNFLEWKVDRGCGPVVLVGGQRAEKSICQICDNIQSNTKIQFSDVQMENVGITDI